MLRFLSVPYPKDMPADVAKVSRWALHTSNLGVVKEYLEQYPCIMDEPSFQERKPFTDEVPISDATKRIYSFVVPQALVVAFEASIEDFNMAKRAEEDKRRAKQDRDKKTEQKLSNKVVMDLTSDAITPPTIATIDLVVWIRKGLKPFSRYEVITSPCSAYNCTDNA
ncbi:hypothetical protein PHYPSEUDO_014785 [Phytophthora pseudosyringae]|uniref:Uncharacterized protein n=1 Tax=Phytophthora pseudosyringae TaxID=221518 RepID=A0A8T1V4U2_9STRA|nr:hypothetical protein PHYPSEUDO_014785 [Phytophthora pseudosyringae]